MRILSQAACRQGSRWLSGSTGGWKTSAGRALLCSWRWTVGERARQLLTEPCEPCEHAARHRSLSEEGRLAGAGSRMTQLRGTEGSPAGMRAGSGLGPATAATQVALLQGCHQGVGPGERL